MTILDLAPHFLASPHAHTLRSIRETGVNLCLWERPARPAIAGLVERVAKAKARLALDVTLDSATVLAATAYTHRPLGAFADDYAFPLWLDDMARLVALFREISGAPAVRLRLERVADPACAAFHADTLALRLLCTYHGSGTQWLENENVRRDELGLRGRTIADANAAMIVDTENIRTIPAWHVAIFKGRAWPGEEANALVHRSFPVCCADHARLRLCLDLAEASGSTDCSLP